MMQQKKLDVVKVLTIDFFLNSPKSMLVFLTGFLWFNEIIQYAYVTFYQTFINITYTFSYVHFVHQNYFVFNISFFFIAFEA